MLWQAFGRWGGVQGTSEGGGGVTTDPYWSNVKLLLGFNGSSGAVTMTDESPAARGDVDTSGSGNQIQISNTNPKFGTGSVRLDGADDLGTYPGHTDWDFSNQPFTIDAWVKFDAASIETTQVIVSQYRTFGDNRGWRFSYSGGLATNILSFTASSTVQAGAAASSIVSFNWTPTAETWYLLSVDRDGSNDWRLYIDGAMVAKANSTITIYQPSTLLRIGCSAESGNLDFLHGNIDELRITKGVARYASDSGFTLPTSPWPRS